MEGGLRGASGGIGGGAEDELVRPITADHGIAAGAHRGPGSNQRVIAVATGHGVAAGEATDQRVVAAAAVPDVDTGTAVKPVIPVVAVPAVRTRAARKRVASGTRAYVWLNNG